MRKTHSLAVGLTAVAALVLTACGSSGGGTSSGGSVGGAAAATAGGAASGTINYWLWDSSQLPAYQACADAFHAANPNATVKVSQYAWDDYWSKITTGFTSDGGPDVFTDHLSKYPEFVNKSEILSISDAIAADKVDTGIYQKGLLSLWTAQDGKIYGLPKDFDTIGLFYNVDMLKAAGVTAAELNSASWNTKDGGTFEAIVAKMTIDKNGKHGNEAGFDPKNVKTYGFNLEDGSAGNGQTQWSAFTGSNGFTYTDQNPWGTKYNYDQASFQDTMTWYRSMITKGYMQALDKVVGADTGKQLGAGTVAMSTEGDWNTSGFLAQKGVKLSIASVPVGPSGKRASMFNGLADSISANSKNQATAIKWVEFTGSAACQDLVAAKAIVFPAIPEATDKAVAAFKAKGVDVTPFTDRVKNNETFLFPITDHAADITAIMGPAMQSFLSFKTDASAFTDANKQVNALFTS